MLREVRFRALEPRERGRWTEALGQAPLIQERRSGEPLWGGCGAAATAAFALLTNTARFGAHPTMELTLHVVRVGVLAAIFAMFAQLAWRDRRVARPPFPVGRFLFRWGYAEVLVDRVRFVSGRELRFAVRIGPAVVSGASRIVIRLFTEDGWATAFRFVGCELDVPLAGLEALATSGLDVSDGYREPARRGPRGRPARWAPSPGFVTALVSIAVGLGGSASVVWSTWRVACAEVADLGTGLPGFRYERADDIVRAYPYFDWVVEATRLARLHIVVGAGARITRDLRAPYREAMMDVLYDEHPTAYTFEQCYFGDEQLAPLTRFAEEHATGGATTWLPRVFTGPNPPLNHYFGFDHPWRYLRDARLRMRSECTLEPLAMLPTTPARASFRVHAEWELRLDERTIAHRALTIEPELIREVADCARPERDLAAAELRAAAGLISLAVHHDVYEPGRGYWVSSVLLEGFEELVPCVRRAEARLQVARDPDDESHEP